MHNYGVMHNLYIKSELSESTSEKSSVPYSTLQTHQTEMHPLHVTSFFLIVPIMWHGLIGF